jgi:endonuclease YncB( thermonuclease family)
MRIIETLARLVVLPSLAALAAAVEVRASVLRVVDGDIVETAPDGGKPTKVRLLYIDTPESKGDAHGEATTEGKLAAEFMDLQARPGMTVFLWGPGEALELDRYGCALAVVITKRGDTLQERVIAAGYSPLWEKYGKADPKWRETLQAAEDKAKAAKVGAWGTDPKYMADKENETTAPKAKD